MILEVHSSTHRLYNETCALTLFLVPLVTLYTIGDALSYALRDVPREKIKDSLDDLVLKVGGSGGLCEVTEQVQMLAMCYTGSRSNLHGPQVSSIDLYLHSRKAILCVCRGFDFFFFLR